MTRDTSTPEEIEARIRASRSTQLTSSESATGETRVIQSQPESVIASSQLLAANGQWTLVPKSAVVHVPKALGSHVVTAPEGTLVPFQEFLLANRSWLSNIEVSIEQASGKDALKPDTVKAWAIQNKIVVATHQGGAISFKTPTPAQP